MTDYERGAAAYWAGQSDDIAESDEWHEGYTDEQDKDNSYRERNWSQIG